MWRSNSMLSVMKTQKMESHKDDRNRGHCACSNGKVESQCEWQARKNGRLNSRARWEGAPHERGMVISVHGSTSPCWWSQRLMDTRAQCGATGQDGHSGPIISGIISNLVSIFILANFIFLLLKGQNFKKIPSKCFTICMVCKYFLKSMTSSWFNSQAQKVQQEMRPTYLLLQVGHAVSGSRLWRYSFSYIFWDFCNFGSCDYICDRFKLIFHYGVRSGSGFIFLHKMFNYPGIICWRGNYVSIEFPL